MKQNKTIYIVPVMFCFFAMGFVDLVGIASNYVKEDLALNDSTANILPSLPTWRDKARGTKLWL